LRLTKLQKRLCNALQKGLPICARPFAEIAKELNTTEKEILQQTQRLKRRGIIRRIGALVNYRVLGMTSTLVAAHVPGGKLRGVAETVNSLENVSHNYLRDHYYNLWFTLQARTTGQIDSILSELSERFGIAFHSLPVNHTFKLEVYFDAESGGQPLLAVSRGRQGAGVPKDKVVKLRESEKLILSKLQDGLKVTAEPFALLRTPGIVGEEVLRAITGLIDKGAIHRIGAVVNHRKLGFIANVLFVSEVPRSRVVSVGRGLARLAIVSHCYERKVFKGWPYNLFAMMHGRTVNQIRGVINKFTKDFGIESFQLLPTAAELKKQPIKLHFY